MIWFFPLCNACHLCMGLSLDNTHHLKLAKQENRPNHSYMRRTMFRSKCHTKSFMLPIFGRNFDNCDRIFINTVDIVAASAITMYQTCHWDGVKFLTNRIFYQYERILNKQIRFAWNLLLHRAIAKAAHEKERRKKSHDGKNCFSFRCAISAIS